MKIVRPAPRLVETYARKPIRMWTIPEDDYTAFPTPEFYREQLVNFSNAGTAAYPRWVALDRNNGYDSTNRRYYRAELAELYDYVIGSQEGFGLWMEPEAALPPPPRGAPLMARIVYFLSKWA